MRAPEGYYEIEYVLNGQYKKQIGTLEEVQSLADMLDEEIKKGKCNGYQYGEIRNEQ